MDGDSLVLLVAAMSVASPSKFQFSSMVLKTRLPYSASAGMLLPSTPLKSMGCTVVSQDLCFRTLAL